MRIHDEIIGMLENARHIPAPVDGNSNLYTDLGFDSLSFISFLIEIEETYAITFDITETEACLQAGRLIELVEQKIRAQKKPEK